MARFENCVVCLNQASKMCTKCKQTRYCSEECQRSHWPRHRGACLLPEEKKGKQQTEFLKMGQDAAARVALLQVTNFLAHFRLTQQEEIEIVTLLASTSAVDQFPHVESKQWLVDEKYIDMMRAGAEYYEGSDDPRHKDAEMRFKSAYLMLGCCKENGFEQTAQITGVVKQMAGAPSQ